MELNRWNADTVSDTVSCYVSHLLTKYRQKNRVRKVVNNFRYTRGAAVPRLVNSCEIYEPKSVMRVICACARLQ